MIPVLMMYKFPFTEMSCVTVFVLLFSPIFLLKVIEGICRHNNIYRTLPLFLYCVWAISKCVGRPIDLILFVVIYIYITAIVVSNVFDVNKARKIIENISIIASIVVMVQYVLYYTVGLSSPVVFVHAWLIEYMQNKIDSTTMAGLFRPSAFFAEPAHFAEYTIIGLVSVLFLSTESKLNTTKAVVITLGIFMTTSGIGIALSLVSWVLWILKNFQKRRTLIFRILASLTVGSLAYFVLMQFNFFSKAIQRVFGEVDGYNAISGRLFWWETYFSGLSMHDWIWGLGYSALPANYFTGFMETVYATGIIGFILLAMTLMNCMLHTKGFSSCLSLMYLGLLFVANITSFILMIFWLSFIYSGYTCKQKLTKTYRISQLTE